MTKREALKKQYQKAIKRLEEILKEKKTDIVRDSAIKRFEFTFDLSWKLLKTYLEEEKGISCQSPKECFREAFKQGLIDYDEFWLKMTDWRNQAVHTYGEKFANSLYRSLPGILKYFQLLEMVIK
jgi:nucleotidyltransferase substrate binding protein (TIGR01987 family)